MVRKAQPGPQPSDAPVEAWPHDGRRVAPRERVENYIDSLVRSGALRISRDQGALFTLRNGTQTVSVDHGDVLCQPEHNRAFVSARRGSSGPSST